MEEELEESVLAVRYGAQVRAASIARPTAILRHAALNTRVRCSWRGC